MLLAAMIGAAMGLAISFVAAAIAAVLWKGQEPKDINAAAAAAYAAAIECPVQPGNIIWAAGPPAAAKMGEAIAQGQGNDAETVPGAAEVAAACGRVCAQAYVAAAGGGVGGFDARFIEAYVLLSWASWDADLHALVRSCPTPSAAAEAAEKRAVSALASAKTTAPPPPPHLADAPPGHHGI